MENNSLSKSNYIKNINSVILKFIMMIVIGLLGGYLVSRYAKNNEYSTLYFIIIFVLFFIIGLIEFLLKFTKLYKNYHNNKE